jgi:adenosylcobyric acid synthase
MEAEGRNPGAGAGHPPDSATLHPGYIPDGAISADNQILGTYLHGLFDSPAACDALLAWAGLVDAKSPDISALREASIERLADTVEAFMDTDKLRAILEGRA